MHSRNNTYDLADESHETNNELWIVQDKREVTSPKKHLNPVPHAPRTGDVEVAWEEQG